MDEYIPPKIRVRNRTLAEDGRPEEMFADVHRACHRWLLKHDREYRFERTSIQQWMALHNIPHPNPTTNDIGYEPRHPAHHQHNDDQV